MIAICSANHQMLKIFLLPLVSIRLAFSPLVVRAKCSPIGFLTANHQWIFGMSTYADQCLISATKNICTIALSRRSACFTRCTGRLDNPTPLAVCANLFCTIASLNVVHVSAKSPVGSARTGLRLLVSNLSMSIHMASKTGLSIQPKNITLCATQSACLISRHSASSSCKGQMRCRYSIKFAPMKLTCRLAKLSIPSGLTKLVASKPT